MNLDINCDVGEGLGNEADLFPLISSCSIACGGHAGDATTMREIVRLAQAHQVRIGAHPSYPDKVNFGRVSMAISEEELITSIQKQLTDLTTILKEENANLNHIKPHGALYNDLAKNKILCKTFLKAIAGYKKNVALFVPFNSTVEKYALREGFKVKKEAFADRNYNNDGSLVSRKLPQALITDAKAVLIHLRRMVSAQQLKTVDGIELQVQADTFCIHGDTPNALEILMYLRENFANTPS